MPGGRIEVSDQNTHDCPQCGQRGLAYESRVHLGTFRRLRSCPAGHRFSTIEVQADAPARIFDAILWACQDKLDPEMLEWLKYSVTKHMIGMSDPADA